MAASAVSQTAASNKLKHDKKSSLPKILGLI